RISRIGLVRPNPLPAALVLLTSGSVCWPSGPDLAYQGERTMIGNGSVLACVLSALAGAGVGNRVWGPSTKDVHPPQSRQVVRPPREPHFRPTSLDDITISERRFPFRVRADLQRAIDRLFGSAATITHFCGVRKEHAADSLNFAALLVDGYSPSVSVPPEYEE